MSPWARLYSGDGAISVAVAALAVQDAGQHCGGMSLEMAFNTSEGATHEHLVRSPTQQGKCDYGLGNLHLGVRGDLHPEP
jgi:hypothetical protein